ncbi:major facilitator superfamily domain-containing protein [Cryomyces antarcticus]
MPGARDAYEQSNTANERQPLLGSRSPSPDDEAAEQSGNGEEDSTPIAEEASTKMLVLTLGSIWVGVFLAALDSTIVATLSAPISTSFDSFTLFSWLASSYLIANAALQPLSGRLTDIFGRRAGLVASNIFFAAGNLICGLAKDEWVIILGRVVAGCGGGGLNAIASFVASDLVPLRKRGLWQGFGNICFGLGSGGRFWTSLLRSYILPGSWALSHRCRRAPDTSVSRRLSRLSRLGPYHASHRSILLIERRHRDSSRCRICAGGCNIQPHHACVAAIHLLLPWWGWIWWNLDCNPASPHQCCGAPPSGRHHVGFLCLPLYRQYNRHHRRLGCLPEHSESRAVESVWRPA